MTEREREKIEKLKIQKRFGEHIVKLRKAQNITPSELGKRCFIERSNISKIESGSANLTLFTMIKISKALNITLTDLTKDFYYK